MPLYGSLAEGFCNCNWVLMYSMGHTARHSIPPAIQPAVIETNGFEDFFTPSSDIFTQRQEEAKGWYFLLCLLCKVQTHRASVAGSCSSLNRSIKQSIPNRCLVHLFCSSFPDVSSSSCVHCASAKMQRGCPVCRHLPFGRFAVLQTFQIYHLSSQLRARGWLDFARVRGSCLVFGFMV